MVFDSTYQVKPSQIAYADVAERYRHALRSYRRSRGQKPGAGLMVSYFKQNSRGLFWIGLATVSTLAFALLTRSKGEEQSNVTNRS